MPSVHASAQLLMWSVKTVTKLCRKGILMLPTDESPAHSTSIYVSQMSSAGTIYIQLISAQC